MTPDLPHLSEGHPPLPRCAADVEPVSAGEPPQRRPPAAAPAGGGPAPGVLAPPAVGGESEPVEEQKDPRDSGPHKVGGDPGPCQVWTGSDPGGQKV